MAIASWSWKTARRYEVEPGTPVFKIMEFERYGFRTEGRRSQARDRPHPQPPAALGTGCRRQRRQPGWRTGVWRIGMPVSALILFMAIPLSYVNPRPGGSQHVDRHPHLRHLQQPDVHEPGLGGPGKLSFSIGVWAVLG